METDPEYYKNQALKLQEQYKQLVSKKIKTIQDDKKIKDLKQKIANYIKMYKSSIGLTEQLQRIQKENQQPKTSNLIKLFKEKETKRKLEQQEQKRLINQQERIDKFLQRGVPTNEDVREDATKLGINIDKELDDNNVEHKQEKISGNKIGEKSDIVDTSDSFTSSQNVPSQPNTIITDEDSNTNIPSTSSNQQELINSLSSNQEFTVDNSSSLDLPSESPSRPSQPPIQSTSLEQPEVINYPSSLQPLQLTKEDIKLSRKTKKVRLGFSETLNNKAKTPEPALYGNTDICKNIFTNGSKVTKKYFYPSEFPKLTKIKPITITMKKGGSKRKSRKYRH